MKEPCHLEILFKQHIEIKTQRCAAFMHNNNIKNIIISSGEVELYFADDLQYPFVANPFFREWLPLDKRAGCFLQLSEKHKPRLYLLEVEDVWHTAPQELPQDWDKYLDIRPYQDASKLFDSGLLSNPSTFFVGKNNAFAIDESRFNATSILNHFDFYRQYKTPYEQFCLREANWLAMQCHTAAKDMFLLGGSELDIQRAYLQEAHCQENDMPYAVIAGLNENAAVLHHKILNSQKITNPKSLLIDAGVAFNCYASDITRTYAFLQGTEFSSLVNEMDRLQLNIVDHVKAGITFAYLNKLTEEKLTKLLIDFGVINVGFDEAMELKLSRTFMPHGIGHGLGVNVHERGMNLLSECGKTCERGEYGLEKPLVGSEVITIEPGLYFIPSLLNKVKNTQPQVLNWQKIAEFTPYGGIRIEDNILINENNLTENLTRFV